MLTIDGAKGEGGGQIVRSSLALSLVTGQPIRIHSIRGGRKRPGLLRQHLTALRAAARIGAAEVEGDALGSAELTFRPTAVLPGDYRFAVGSAGSATLVLQTVLPALLTASARSTLTIEGGTHNPFAPPFPFLQQAYLPLVRRMGPGVVAELERPGFYPAGGGRFRVEVDPAEALSPLSLLERGELRSTRAEVWLSALAPGIAARESQRIRERLGLARHDVRVIEVAEPVGPGNLVSVTCEHEHVTEVFTGFGRREASAEMVADEAIAEVEQFRAAGVAVGAHLADQLALLCALAGEGAYTTVSPTLHTRTHLAVIEQLLGTRSCVVPLGDDRFRIEIGRAVA